MENLSDAQIASLLVAINQSEIDEGKMMVGKATNADVKKFAQQMVDDHTTMLNGVQAWQKKTSSAASATSQTLTDMQNEVKTEMADLGKLSGAALDKKYVDGAVTGHQKVLDMMDHGLIDQADDADLKTAIRDARTKVAAHLDAAKKLQMTAGTHPAQVGTPSNTTASNGK
jgi:putative membrane protein